MADGEEVTLDGRPLHLLRVADLKAALERRGLAKSGQKSALVKRLRGVRRNLGEGVVGGAAILMGGVGGRAAAVRGGGGERTRPTGGGGAHARGASR